MAVHFSLALPHANHISFHVGQLVLSATWHHILRSLVLHVKPVEPWVRQGMAALEVCKGM